MDIHGAATRDVQTQAATFLLRAPIAQDERKAGGGCGPRRSTAAEPPASFFGAIAPGITVVEMRPHRRSSNHDGEFMLGMTRRDVANCDLVIAGAGDRRYSNSVEEYQYGDTHQPWSQPTTATGLFYTHHKIPPDLLLSLAPTTGVSKNSDEYQVCWNRPHGCQQWVQGF
jgi:hypothetical protein